MKLAFCLFNYFPHGGMQRNFLRMAEEAQRRGHEVTIFAGKWQGPTPPGLHIAKVDYSGILNHHKNINFYKNLRAKLAAERHDVVVGFNKMPGLDVYYAADICFKERMARRSLLYKMMPRYRRFVAFERATFDPNSGTEILLPAEAQRDVYIRHYGTPLERFHVLPPDVAPDRIVSVYEESSRVAARETLGIDASALIVLMVGSNFRVKGLARALQAVASLSESVLRRVRFLVVGQGNSKPFTRLASRLGIADRVRFLGLRDDIPQLMLAANLLVHPAHHENTGNVLLEAMACGLPVLVTDVCGYAEHIRAADSGLIVASPFVQSDLNAKLSAMLQSEMSQMWAMNGISYIRALDPSARMRKALAVIEAKGGIKTDRNAGKAQA